MAALLCGGARPLTALCCVLCAQCIRVVRRIDAIDEEVTRRRRHAHFAHATTTGEVIALLARRLELQQHLRETLADTDRYKLALAWLQHDYHLSFALFKVSAHSPGAAASTHSKSIAHTRCCAVIAARGADAAEERAGCGHARSAPHSHCLRCARASAHPSPVLGCAAERSEQWWTEMGLSEERLQPWRFLQGQLQQRLQRHRLRLLGVGLLWKDRNLSGALEADEANDMDARLFAILQPDQRRRSAQAVKPEVSGTASRTGRPPIQPASSLRPFTATVALRRMRCRLRCCGRCRCAPRSRTSTNSRRRPTRSSTSSIRSSLSLPRIPYSTVSTAHITAHHLPLSYVTVLAGRGAAAQVRTRR